MTKNLYAYRLLAEDIANLFYELETSDNAEGSRGSIAYWNHLHDIEDIITHFVQDNDLTLDNGR